MQAAESFSRHIENSTGDIRSRHGHPSTGGGWTSYYMEEHHSVAQTMQAVVTSLVFEGVFERFPELRVVIMEGGLIIAEGSPNELIEEHVSPQVLEFRGSPDELERLRPVIEAAADAVERTGEALLAFTADADELMERVRASDVEVENTVYRQSGLEDVFLRLTGRRLIE